MNVVHVWEERLLANHGKYILFVYEVFWVKVFPRHEKTIWSIFNQVFPSCVVIVQPWVPNFKLLGRFLTLVETGDSMDK